MIDRWQLLHQDDKIRVLYNTLKILLGSLAIVMTSEYVSKAFAIGITGSWMIYYGEAMSLFILDSIALREGRARPPPDDEPPDEGDAQPEQGHSGVGEGVSR